MFCCPCFKCLHWTPLCPAIPWIANQPRQSHTTSERRKGGGCCAQGKTSKRGQFVRVSVPCISYETNTYRHTYIYIDIGTYWLFWDQEICSVSCNPYKTMLNLSQPSHSPSRGHLPLLHPSPARSQEARRKARRHGWPSPAQVSRWQANCLGKNAGANGTDGTGKVTKIYQNRTSLEGWEVQGAGSNCALPCPYY